MPRLPASQKRSDVRSERALQAFTRDGFDPSRHPLSLLSLGDLGWIQIANFIVTGALFMACAAGLRHAMSPGMGSRWGPRLSPLSGRADRGRVFVTDAGAGFPADAPSGAPKMSWLARQPGRPAGV
jgi:hypothetical protein